jgi:diguanylate cyclase (GGDEF)-like protein
LSASSKERAGNGIRPARSEGNRSDASPRAASVVGFGERAAELMDTRERVEGSLDLEAILNAVRETAYRWDFAQDEIDWATNASGVLGLPAPMPVRGRAFALLVEAEHAGGRYDAITGGPHVVPQSDVRYRVQYRLRPEGRRGRAAIWVEDSGVCHIGADGQPQLAQGTLRVIDDRHEQEERLRFLGNHDELTGQLNRTRLTEELMALLADASRQPRDAAFLLAAVNDLTLINETYGFDVGDEVIAIVGRRLARTLRDKDCLGRFSSNKFGIVLHDCSAEGAETIARRLMAAVRDSVIETNVGPVATTVSIGALLLPKHASNAQAAIGRALQALDIARNRASDQFALYEPSERRESERRRAVSLADEIVRALNDRRMLLALQPIVTSKSREPELYECLLRMQRLDGTILPARDFIPTAELFGLIKLVDHRVLELAIELLRGSPAINLALNVSAATAADGQWLKSLEALSAKDRSLTSRLTVEITETAAISDVPETMRFVRALKALGCRVALDDFGAGYTSFRSLRTLGVDMVKIDGSFIQNLGTQAEDELFVRTLIELARNFGITTVGEWVGDERTARLLENAGVAYMQGYFFGAPELTSTALAESRPA